MLLTIPSVEEVEIRRCGVRGLTIRISYITGFAEPEVSMLAIDLDPTGVEPLCPVKYTPGSKGKVTDIDHGIEELKI